jgi:TRAP-type C4-dicarboxylate transport system substrate-binding protein
MSKKFLTAAAVGAAAAALLAGVAQAQEFTFRMHTFVPPVSNPVKTFYQPWADTIEKASGGRIKVQVFSSMQLGGKAPQLLDQVRDGVVDMVWTLPGFTPGRMPRTEPFELPFVHQDAVSTTLAMQDYQAMHLGPDLKDYHPLLMHAHAGFLFQTKAPIATMADLKGMKLRAAARSGVWLLEAVGATGLGLPLPEIPAALSKGVIDGVTLPYEIAPAVKTPELCNYFTTLSGPQPRLGTNVFAFLMNKASYDKLPADLKKVIDDNSGGNIAAAAGKNWEEVEKPGLAAAQAQSKNKFNVLPEAEVMKIREAAKPVFKIWFDEVAKEGIDGPKLLADAEALIAKYAK